MATETSSILNSFLLVVKIQGVKLTPPVHPQNRPTLWPFPLWPRRKKKEQPNSVSPPSPSPSCLPGLAYRPADPDSLACPRTWTWDVTQQRGRGGQMKGKNRRVTGHLHMNYQSKCERRGWVKGWRAKVNPPHPNVPHRPLPNWCSDKGNGEQSAGCSDPCCLPLYQEGVRGGGVGE